MSYECMLTTIDNPYDPFDNFDSWLLFDKEKGYDSCERLARIAITTDDMSMEEVKVEIERAIDTIIMNDIFDIYKKVTREVESDD